MSEYFEDDIEDGVDERIDELQQTIDELQETIKALKDKIESSSNGLAGGYLLGTAIAVVASWSRNASILWCILHGIFSWVYVIYFAITR